MSESFISEKTVIRLTISSWWHVVILVGVIVLCYAGLKADTQTALRLGEENQSGLRQTQSDISSMRSDIRSVTDNVNWFRQQYERDMSRYIREPGRQ